MSSRHIRRLLGTTLAPPEVHSDEEFEPLFCKEGSASSPYDGLQISSTSEKENVPSEEDKPIEDPLITDKKKKKKKKKKKSSKMNTEPTAGVVVDEDSDAVADSIPELPDNTPKKELDEIDEAVLAINSLMGELPLPSACEIDDNSAIKLVKELFRVQSKHLNYQNEARRFYGLEEPGTRKKRPQLGPKHRRPVIIPLKIDERFPKANFTMSFLRREEGFSYFVLNHNRTYQTMHKEYLEVWKARGVMPPSMLEKNMHLEGLLAFCDYLFNLEDYTTGRDILEMIIANLQHNAHQNFILTDWTNRLEYVYYENRVFHVAVLKFMYILSSKAMHRSALELCKLLLNLDPSDPMAVIFIIDTIALRAREFEWFIKVVDYFDKTRPNVGAFPNLRLSMALAQFHLDRKNKVPDFTRADQLLQQAIMQHPNVAVRIYKEIYTRVEPEYENHALFSPAYENQYYTCDKVRMSLSFVVKMVFPRWREPAVWKWFQKNLQEVLQKYDTDDTIRLLITHCALKNQAHNSVQPIEVDRHMAVIHTMAVMLADSANTGIDPGQPWNPVPPPDGGINRYKYGKEEVAEVQSNYSYYGRIMRDFFTSMSPNFNPEEDI